MAQEAQHIEVMKPKKRKRRPRVVAQIDSPEGYSSVSRINTEQDTQIAPEPIPSTLAKQTISAQAELSEPTKISFPKEEHTTHTQNTAEPMLTLPEQCNNNQETTTQQNTVCTSCTSKLQKVQALPPSATNEASLSLPNSKPSPSKEAETIHSSITAPQTNTQPVPNPDVQQNLAPFVQLQKLETQCDATKAALPCSQNTNSIDANSEIFPVPISNLTLRISVPESVSDFQSKREIMTQRAFEIKMRKTKVLLVTSSDSQHQLEEVNKYVAQLQAAAVATQAIDKTQPIPEFKFAGTLLERENSFNAIDIQIRSSTTALQEGLANAAKIVDGNNKPQPQPQNKVGEDCITNDYNQRANSSLSSAPTTFVPVTKQEPLFSDDSPSLPPGIRIIPY